MQDPLEGLSEFQKDWYRSGRPLFIVDEIRDPEPGGGLEWVSYVFLETDTTRAYRLASEAQGLRAENLKNDKRETVYKGSTLFGDGQRASHEFLRKYVQRSVAGCRSGYILTTSSAVLRQYKDLAPGGIRAEPAPSVDRAAATIEGRELVPFMNMTKQVALFQKLGDLQVDVLLDRSKQLGMDPASRQTPAREFDVYGPETLNEQRGGAPASAQCPASFRFIAGDDKGGFRDLLLLPDAAAYALSRSGALKTGIDEVRTGKRDFFVATFAPSTLFVERGR